jgi:hypothetical protein
MAYIVQRTTKAGSLSTALSESHRDEHGRPRRHQLANLHGETDPLRALAKVETQGGVLLEMRDELLEEWDKARKAYEAMDEYSPPAERRKVVREESRLFNQLTQVENTLTALVRDCDAIKKHCGATQEAIDAAIETHRQEFRKAFELSVGLHLASREAKAKLDRLSR